MNSSDIIFNNFNKLIEDTKNLIIDFRNVNELDEFKKIVNVFFEEYEYKPNIVKGITSALNYKMYLTNKYNWLQTIMKELICFSDTIPYKEKIIDDENFLKFSIKSIIENRLLPLLGFVINEIELILYDDQSRNQKDLIDLSNNKGTEKIIILHQLGVLHYLKEKAPFNTSTNVLAAVLSGITGLKQNSIYPMINPIFNSKNLQRSNPLKTEKTLSKVNNELTLLGFKIEM